MHDLPEPPSLEVTGHRAQAVCCPGCLTRTRAAFPADAVGPRLEGLAVYLRYVQHLPVARLRELHGAVLSTGTVEALCRRAAARLEGRGDIWKAYAGTAVHDRFASCLSQLPDETAHGGYNAHLLRNLEEIVELEKVPDG